MGFVLTEHKFNRESKTFIWKKWESAAEHARGDVGQSSGTGWGALACKINQSEVNRKDGLAEYKDSPSF